MNAQNNAERSLLMLLHEQACERGDMSYRDPQTGYVVFTKLQHLKRGYCCNSGCRHCPYGFRKEQDKAL